MTRNRFDVSGTTVLVSGGSRGIGLAMAEAFAREGARVIISGRNEATLAAICEAAQPTPFAMRYHSCDVAVPEAIAACVDAVAKDCGGIDTLINCAGVNKRMPALDYTAAEYDEIMATNLRGAFFMAQAVGRQMVQQGGGSQINIDSLSTHAALSQIAPYSMSKSGLSSMTRTLAMEWGKHGVRVNAVAPGFILTELTEKLWSSPKLRAWHDTVTPLRRMGTVEDLVGAAIFLASPAAGFLTGQIIRIDGGISAGLNWPIEEAH
ncbi:SDR family NAD(P)-dependent oxidoreductase [Hoeflea sp. YIM 152468]|uniref:SDR family NAD(P)-dependent oxidoreductase n=1 Tax=Hoeflea sp. YIM 152468 TaxID=3031759 RepID=UPI0023DB47C8|nr:SDR family oxidoreductase [Hoeflea sp. YIM 152468]MDF1610185.1 SDR family NAD(P)-dependent oxidoreductase [Hoeflea sp. YIM 152468]